MKTEAITLSDFARGFEFEDIRALYNHEVPAITQTLIHDPSFMKAVAYLWPDMTIEQVKEKAARVHRCIDFQKEFMHGAIRRIVETTSSGLSSSGFEKLEHGKPYLFIANHRDILLDAAILQVLLVEHNLETSEITFGSNLKGKGFISEFGKLNRMLTVEREGTNKELYQISKKLSAYIRHTIVDKEVSLWISQRNGRTKDGNDVTKSGLLKMLNLSGTGDLSENFGQLNIVPVTISYEYEPCDHLKTQELYLSGLNEGYVKAEDEDMESTITGIRQFKGKIHLSIGDPLNTADFAYLRDVEDKNEKFTALAQQIDRRIYSDYRLSPLNYIAQDLLTATSSFEAFYSADEKNNFIAYVDKKVSFLKGDQEQLKQIFLKLYAQPLINQLDSRVEH